MSDERTFVIVGASLAGAKAAETLRAEGFAGRIVLVGEEPDRPYERPPLSKGYLRGKDPLEKAFVHDSQWYAANNIDLVLGVRVTAVDPKAHTVTLADGATQSYDTLLLATGSRVRRLEVTGSDLQGIHYLRTISESDAIRAQLREDAHVVIVGAGWIGLETAAAARAAGANVTVVEMGSLPLRRVLGDELATFYADLHRAHGVDFRFSAQVREFVGEGAQLTEVLLDDGTRIPADMAVVGVGIVPNVELAVAAGLVVEDGVVTDASLRTSEPDIFACGDVASSDNPMVGRRVRVEHWANALNGGPAAARAMLGQDVSFDRVPYFYSDQYESSPGVGMEYAGYVAPGGYDQVVFRGSPDLQAGTSPEFVAFWVAGGRVLAGMNVNVWDIQDGIQRLVRAGYAGRAVDLARLADPAVALEDLLS